MEEIFKSVLSYAEKLTSASGNPSEDQSDPLQHRQQSSSECPDGLEEQSEFNYTPDDGVEMSDEHLMFASQDSRMFASRYDFAQSAPNYTGQVSHLLASPRRLST